MLWTTRYTNRRHLRGSVRLLAYVVTYVVASAAATAAPAATTATTASAKSTTTTADPTAVSTSITTSINSSITTIAPTADAGAADFAHCIGRLQQSARSQGHSGWLVDDVLQNLQPQTRVIELDRAQPEFVQPFAAYLNRRVNEQRVTEGRGLRGLWRDYLNDLTRSYGIPGHYLLALWGLETNFGKHLGAMPVLDSLATLACDPRRSEFFTIELFTALRLLEREALQPVELRGSWAGAMGHTQFMPSAYLKYAVDGDGDGRADLWRSERDALASSANFLKHLGWQTGERWGREVRLPVDFPYVESGLEIKQPIGYWAERGVTLASGAALPDIDMQGSILVPAGHAGPAFLVYRNYDVIMRWNRSESYALAVGLLADRIAGAGNLIQPPSAAQQPISREVIRRLQLRLRELGLYTGAVDGMLGPLTRIALRAFQNSAGFVADGYPDRDTLGALQLDAVLETVNVTALDG